MSWFSFAFLGVRRNKPITKPPAIIGGKNAASMGNRSSHSYEGRNLLGIIHTTDDAAMAAAVARRQISHRLPIKIAPRQTVTTAIRFNAGTAIRAPLEAVAELGMKESSPNAKRERLRNIPEDNKGQVSKIELKIETCPHSFPARVLQTKKYPVGVPLYPGIERSTDRALRAA